MALPEALLNLAKSVDLRIEALNAPTAAGQPQVFQIRPAALLLSAVGPLIPTEAVLSAAIPVDIDVVWGVEDEKGTPLTAAEAVVHSGAVPNALQATVMVRPDFVELRSGMEIPIKTRYVTATAKLGVQGKEMVAVPLLRAPVSVPAVPIPTVALFFAKKKLGLDDEGALAAGDQFMIIAVPRDSPIGSVSALRFALDKLREVSRTAAQIVGLAGAAGGLADLTGLAAPLDELINAVNAHAIIGGRVGVAFIPADSVRNLNDVDLILGAHIWNNDIEAEDTISSCALLGPPGRRIRCFKDRNFTGRNVAFRASSLGLTIVDDFAHPTPTTRPAGHATTTSGALDDELSGYAFL